MQYYELSCCCGQPFTSRQKKKCGEYFLQFLDVVRPEDLARAAKSRVDLKGMATLEAQ